MEVPGEVSGRGEFIQRSRVEERERVKQRKKEKERGGKKKEKAGKLSFGRKLLLNYGVRAGDRGRAYLSTLSVVSVPFRLDSTGCNLPDDIDALAIIDHLRRLCTPPSAIYSTI